MDWPYKYFTKEEMQCQGVGCCDKNDPANLPRPEFMVKLEAIREEYGEPMVVSSGFRCAKHNAEVSSTGNDGAHVQGLAADIKVAGSEAYKLLHFAVLYGMTGIGVMQHGNHDKRFLHLDCVPAGDATMPRNYLWSYS